MRKVTKILLKLISTAILLLIIVPLLLSILLTIPAIQNRAITYATTLVGNLLDTRINIESINLGAFGRVQFGNVYIEDYQKDTLLYAQKLDLSISKVGLASRQIKVGYAAVEGGQLNLRQTQDSILNLKQIIDHLTPETPANKSLVLIFEDLSLSDFDVSIDLLNHRTPNYGVDYGDMKIENINAKVDNLTIDGPTIHTTINSFSCHEKSGFELLSMSGSLYLSNGVISVENAEMESRYSQMSLPYVMIVGSAWSDYRDFINNVDMVAEVRNSTLSSDDVAYFSPRLRDWGITLSDLDINVDGTVDNLGVEVVNSSFAESSSLAANIHITELPNFMRSRFSIQINECQTNPSDVEGVFAAIVGRELPREALQAIRKSGDIDLVGNFNGTLSDFNTDFDLISGLGLAQATATMSKGESISGYIDTQDFNIGELLNSKELGQMSTNSNFSGNVRDIMQSAMVQGEISMIDIRGKSYNNITYSGHIESGDFNGEVQSRNRGFDFDVAANINFTQSSRWYDLEVKLNDLDLKALRLSQRDSLANLSTTIKAVGSGDNIDNLEGDINIVELRYLYDDSVLNLSDVTLHTSNDSNFKNLELKSDFADVVYRSHDSYQVSFDYLRNSLRTYLPALYGLDDIVLRHNRGNKTTQTATDLNQYSMFSINVKDLKPITSIVSEGLEISSGSRLDVVFNPISHDLSLSMTSKYVETNSVLALDIHVDATNNMDSLAVYSSIKELLVGTRQIEDISILGGAKHNRARLVAGYKDPTNEGSATFDAVVHISNDLMRGRMASVHLLPSQLTQGEQMWDVKARNIEIDKNGILIDRFMIQNDEQEFLVEGLASRSTADTLRADMSNFDLSILSALTETLGYSFNGVTNGDVVISSALRNMRVEANVLLDSVSVNSLPAPPMRVLADWDANLNQAAISITDRIKGDTLVRGYYIPSEVKYYAKLEVDSLHIGLLDAPLGGIISNSTGYVNANLSISGEHRNATLEGYLDVRDMESKIDYTNVTYRIPEARINVTSNEMVCRNAQIYDQEGNSGRMTLSVNLQHLSNITYKVRLNVDDVLALNTTLNDNDLFYGTMYATGVIDIEGNKLGVNMDITATTMENSEFYMPLMNKTDISTAEFITFVNPTNVIDSTDVIAVKRRSYEIGRGSKVGGGNNLNINMSLNVTPEASFQLVIDPTVGDVIRGRGEGRMNIRINPKSNIFEMYGDYTISEGNYLFTLRNIINKRFIINPGSTIQWTGDPLNAFLDIEAVYKLKTSLQPLIIDESSRSVPVDCIIILQDRLMQPEVSFEISLPTADSEQQASVANLLNDQESISRQFFYLMLANSFVSESSGSSGSEFGVSTTTATGFELLTNQLSNWLSSSNYNVVIRYRPESELSGDELDFGISRSLINNRLLVEVEGNYSNDTSEEDATASNFTGEAYVTWLIDRSGALKLKGFTQTIDRYDENQGLQETGIGIYYRESFDNFKDLKERVKARFSRKSISIRKASNYKKEEEAEEEIKDETEVSETEKLENNNK